MGVEETRIRPLRREGHRCRRNFTLTESGSTVMLSRNTVFPILRGRGGPGLASLRLTCRTTGLGLGLVHGPSATRPIGNRLGVADHSHVTGHEGGLTLGAGVHLRSLDHARRFSSLNGLGGRDGCRVGTCRLKAGSPGAPTLPSDVAGLVAATAFPIIRALLYTMASLPTDGTDGGLARVPHSAVKARHTKDGWHVLGDGHSNTPSTSRDAWKSIVGHLDHFANNPIGGQQLPHGSVGHLTGAVAHVDQARAGVSGLNREGRYRCTGVPPLASQRQTPHSRKRCGPFPAIRTECSGHRPEGLGPKPGRSRRRQCS